MNKPELKKHILPKHIDDYPVGPSYNAGYLTSENSGWRSVRPLVDTEQCTGCWQCYMCCPEGVIFKEGKVINIDFAFCKGCGICARICPKKVISMIKEEKG